MVHTLDLDFLGRTGVIASALLDGPGGAVVVDPGPTTSLDGLRAALAAHGRTLEEVRALLLTHIHLDHAGATGSIVRINPRIEVFVHERGAAHVIDPGKLLQSAQRLYGEDMQRLWGEIAPVPAGNVRALRGGEVLSVAGRQVQVAYTPGHASHHVSYLDTATGMAFAGDVGGIRIGAPLLVIPPTPPPDIDLEAWDASLDLLRAWRPDRLFVTHFGSHDQPIDHLADLQVRLRATGAVVRSLLAGPAADDREREARFADWVRDSFRERLADEESVRRYEAAVPVAHCWQGLARYWRKRAG
jgi:glyoxylase-like metal-dependent hydrolase (beta-lactamase superfamily II)